MNEVGAAAIVLGASAEKAHALDKACARFKIRDHLEVAHLLAQFAHETGGFRVFTESFNYSADRVVAVFGTKRITREQAEMYGRTAGRPADQRGLANALYGGAWGRKNLGNTQPNDGWAFRGSGDIQITGRDNFTRCSLALYGDLRLVENPDMARTAEGGSLCGLWFWTANKCGAPARADNVVEVTRIINRGLAGLADRREWLVKAKRAMGVA